METFFTSDTHFGHNNIITYGNRPFSNAEEMDETLIENWREMVKPEDRVYHLGDLTLRTTRQTLDRILPRLTGEIHLILGNHDWWWENASPPKRAELLAYIHVEPNLMFLDGLDDKPITLCHYPMLEWPESQTGSIHLHGHTHNLGEWWGRSQVHRPMSGDIMGVRINMCVENWGYRPVPWPFIKATADRLIHGLE